MDDAKIVFTDRYQALGVPYPDPATMCPGPCEGLGCYPQHRDDAGMTPEERAAWEEAEAKSPAVDGWHLVPCLLCKGTGLRPQGQVDRG